MTPPAGIGIGLFLWPEPLGRAPLIWAAIGFAGLVLFMNPGLVDWGNGRVLAGNTLLLLAAILWAVGSCLYRRHSWRSPFWVQTSVEIFIAHAAAKRAFDQLQADREPIGTEFGAPLDWQRMEDRKGCRIAVFRTDMDPNIEAQRPSQYDWLLDQMERVSRVFTNRIRALRLDNLAEADVAPGSIEAPGL